MVESSEHQHVLALNITKPDGNYELCFLSSFPDPLLNVLCSLCFFPPLLSCIFTLLFLLSCIRLFMLYFHKLLLISIHFSTLFLYLNLHCRCVLCLLVLLFSWWRQVAETYGEFIYVYELCSSFVHICVC